MLASAERRSSTGRWNTIAWRARPPVALPRQAIAPDVGASRPWHRRMQHALARAVRARGSPCAAPRRSSHDTRSMIAPAAGDERHVVERRNGRRCGIGSSVAALRRLLDDCAAALMREHDGDEDDAEPSASGRSPLLVSSAMAVVMTRVTPSMLPPTMMTAPTSAAARPKPASTTVTSEKRVSQSSVPPRPSASRPASAAARVFVPGVLDHLARQRGDDRRHEIVCAITIAVGVNRRPSSPSGPARDSSR